jgi:hypothetical protein
MGDSITVKARYSFSLRLIVLRRDRTCADGGWTVNRIVVHRLVTQLVDLDGQGLWKGGCAGASNVAHVTHVSRLDGPPGP